MLWINFILFYIYIYQKILIFKSVRSIYKAKPKSFESDCNAWSKSNIYNVNYNINNNIYNINNNISNINNNNNNNNNKFVWPKLL